MPDHPFFKRPPEPMQVQDKPADDQHHSGYKPKGESWHGYILHATARRPGGNSINWLTWQSPDNVSSQRLVEPDGWQYKIGQDNQIMHHAGGSRIGTTINLNRWYRGIEIENTNGRNGIWEPYPWIQVDTVARIVVEWWYIDQAFLPVHPHLEVDYTSGKTDPAKFPWPLYNERIAFHLAKLL